MKSLQKFSNPNFNIIYLIVCMFFIPLTCTAQLSGTYTIDPVGGDFPNFVSFQAAVDSLMSQGVNGPVVFNVADGTYTEKIQINQITGASAANRITFQSASLDSTTVTLTYQNTSSSNNWVIFLYGADYVTIRKMRLQATGDYYARVININGNAHHNIIENCQLWDPLTTFGNAEIIASFSSQAENNTIRNNYFLNGNMGIRMEGIDAGTLSSGTQIYGNIFIDQGSHAIYLQYQNAPKVYSDSINLSTGPFGIYMYLCYNDLEIRNNNINILDGSDGGIYLRYCYGNAGLKALVSNNFIRIGGYKDPAQGIKTFCCEHVNIYHNSVNITSTTTAIASTGAYFQDDPYGGPYSSNIDLRNNIFANSGGGYACNVENDWVIASDYNNFFATGANLASWKGIVEDLQALQSATGKDLNSVSVNPRFFSATNLHTNTYWLDGLGATGLGITTDIDGETRSSPPDIGADEFTPISPLAAGTYTIGGSSPHYATIKDAFDELQVLGILGPVTFEIRNGEYNEFIGKVGKIPGTSPSDTVVFTSESGNPENVVIYYTTDETNYRNIIQLEGVDYLTLKNLTVTAEGESYGRAIAITGKSEKINVINNILSSANTFDAIISLTGGAKDNIVINNNEFSKGGRGIYFYGDADNYSTNTQIIGNTFTGSGVDGIRLGYHISPRIIDNTITNTEYTGFKAVELVNCNKDLEIIGNSIINSIGEYGIKLENCVATNPFEGLVSNNMIQVGATGTAYGIWVNNSKRQNIYHNSLNITSTESTNGKAIFIQDNNEEINVINNVLANTGNGYAVYINDGTDITSSDYNNFYSKSASHFISYGAIDYTDLVSYRTASSKDANSLSVDPLFYSATDLHSEQAAFFEAGTPLTDVPYDIDSVSRTLTAKPDLGAAEFTCGTPAWNIVVSPTCYGDSTTLIDLSTNIARGSTFGWDFDGDYVPDEGYTSKKMNDTITYFFDTPGIHNVNFIVDQIAGCLYYTAVNVSVNDVPAIEITASGAYCGENDGEAVAGVSGGTAPYDYFWSTGETGTSITGLALGIYTLAVTDANGCTSTEEFTIEEALQVEVTQLKPSTCGIPDGTAVVTATGGVEPYSYVWSNGETNDTNSTLSTGKHYVNVIDNNDCYAQGYINIESDGSGPQVTLESVTNNVCYGNRTGAIDISVSGGIEPYAIVWSNGATTQDIDNLAAGIYDVLVTAADGCLGAGTFAVTQPPGITISVVVEDASCAGADGKAMAVVSGGTQPYAYMWSSGGIYQLEEGLAAGIHSVTVTDARGCQEVKPVIVNNVGGPVVTINSVTGASCSNPVDGAIDISISGGTPLYSFLWSPGGQTTADISGLSPGTYQVEVTDQAGCIGVNTADVEIAAPEVNPICLVTVDTLTGKNMVVWGKQDTTDVDYYVIYRETNLKGAYQPIGISPVDSLSVFIDTLADPTIRSWRYRLSAVDVCGVESQLSDYHKTMHLTINLGLDNNINLIWDHYEGFDVNTYDVWRYTASTGWEKIASMPANLTSYTDIDPPDEDLTYYIEVIKPGDPCIPTKLKAGTLNSSKSNRQSRLKASEENQSPTDISLDNNTINENAPAGSLIGRFTTTDPDPGDTHTYSLVTGTGSDDNGSFTISGDSLLAAEIFDFETKSSYNIRVKTTDSGAGNLSFEEQMTVTVANLIENQAPTDISIDNASIDEDEPIGSLVGRFTTTDPDAGDTHTYALVTGTGSEDNSSFSITGDSLLTAEIFDFETKALYHIRIKTTDSGEGNMSFEKTFNIGVNDVVETGLDQKTYHEIRIYPNPFTDRVTIEFSNPDNNEYSLKITDLSGKVVIIVDNIKDSRYILERDGLENGYYIIELKGDNLYRCKIVVE
ncbi:MAG: hypothetical protein AMS27_10390 [Bacteroides sp. SM23_62_1]|nr:MAG: hypothetical protein AMS27_10390 [Bacteroides sp. SM23_62_1]